jgi:hypothetical protein
MATPSGEMTVGELYELGRLGFLTIEDDAMAPGIRAGDKVPYDTNTEYDDLAAGLPAVLRRPDGSLLVRSWIDAGDEAMYAAADGVAQSWGEEAIVGVVRWIHRRPDLAPRLPASC